MRHLLLLAYVFMSLNQGAPSVSLEAEKWPQFSREGRGGRVDKGPCDADGTCCVSGFCLPKEYNKLEPPKGQSIIDLSLLVLDVLSVDDGNFCLTLHAFVCIRWLEPRLSSGGAKRKDEEGVDMDPQFLESLWFPHIMIGQLKSYDEISELRPQTTLRIKHLRPGNNRSGVFEIVYMQGVILTFLCPMRFTWYPLDSQECYLRFGSSLPDTREKLTSVNLQYIPEVASIVLEHSVSMRALTDEENMPFYFSDNVNRSTSGIQISLTRNKLKFISNYYLPSGLFVIVSWMSFLIPPHVIAGRMALLITLFLCLINTFLGTTKDTPNTEMVTALTVWMITCILFLFGALCAYAYLLWQAKRSRSHTKSSSRPNHASEQARRQYPTGGESEDNGQGLTPRQHLMSEKREGTASREVSTSPEDGAGVDDACLVCFPICFLLFNLLYWGICLARASDANYRDEREHFRAFFELFKEWTSTPSVWCGGGSGGAC